MKIKLITLILAFIYTFSAAAQPGSTETKTNVIIRGKLQVGTDTSRYFQRIETTITDDNTHRDAPTERAVYRFVKEEAESKSIVNASGQYLTRYIYVTTLTSNINITLPQCTAATNGKLITIVKTSTDNFSARINLVAPNTWLGGSNEVRSLYGQHTSATCQCHFFVTGQYAFHLF